MGSKQIDLVGMHFGRLVVLEQQGSTAYGKTKKRMWLCKCSCENTVVLNTGALTSGNTKSCGCLHDELSADIGRNSRHKVANPIAGYKSIMCSYKSNALARGHEFSLTLDEFIKIITSKCYYCGIEPCNIYNQRYYNVSYNGIDRMDNSIGYILSNVVPCCKMCNIAKNNNTYDEFLQWLDRFVSKRLIELVKNNPDDATLGNLIRTLVN